MQPTNTDMQTGWQPHKIGQNETQSNTSLELASNNSVEVLRNFTDEMKRFLSSRLTLLQVDRGMSSLDVVIQGRNKPVAMMYQADKQMCWDRFQKLLNKIALVYFGAQNTAEDVIIECYKNFLRQYPTMGIDEIREAHNLQSASQQKAYSGYYTVNIFNETMHAYIAHRNKIIKAYDDTIAEKERIEAEETEKRKEEFRQQTLDWFQRQKSICSLKSWQDIPVYFARELYMMDKVGRGEMEIQERAKVEARKQVEAEASQTRMGGDRIKAKKLIDSIAQKDITFIDRCRNIYVQMLTWKAIHSKF